VTNHHLFIGILIANLIDGWLGLLLLNVVLVIGDLQKVDDCIKNIETDAGNF
jgi:hypothetical protein